MHVVLFSNGDSPAFDGSWTHSRLLYVNIREVQDPDSDRFTTLRQVILFDNTFQIQVGTTDVHCLERYSEDDNKITLRLNENWGKVCFMHLSVPFLIVKQC